MPEKKTIERARCRQTRGEVAQHAGRRIREGADRSRARRQARREVREAGDCDRVVGGAQVGCRCEGAEEGRGVRCHSQESGEGQRGRSAQDASQREHGIEDETFSDVHAGAQTRGQQGCFAQVAFEADSCERKPAFCSGPFGLCQERLGDAPQGGCRTPRALEYSPRICSASTKKGRSGSTRTAFRLASTACTPGLYAAWISDPSGSQNHVTSPFRAPCAPC